MLFYLKLYSRQWIIVFCLEGVFIFFTFIVVKIFIIQACSLRKSWREPIALNLWNPGFPAYGFYEKTMIF